MYLKTLHLVTLCDKVTVSSKTKRVTKLRVHCTQIMHERIIFLGFRPDYNENLPLVRNTYQFSLVSAQPILSQKVTQSELKFAATFKVENILKSSLDSIPLPSPSVKIQITGRKVFLQYKSKTLLGIVKKFVDITQQCFALLPQVKFPANNLNLH